jgi:hypothetical protein
MRGLRTVRDGWLLVVGAAVLYVGLALPLVYRQGVHWDEQTDFEIAASFLEGPREFLVGSGTDSITTRLPMFTVAVLDLVGLELSLRNARLVSVAAGVATLFGTYWLACLLSDRRKAVVAVLIVATSPYFLAYSPLALSEGDAFITAAATWMAVAAVQCAASPTWWRCALLGLLLGLSVSAKFSGIALLPAVALATLLPLARRAENPPTGLSRHSWPWLALTFAMAGWLTAQAIATGAVWDGLGESLPRPLQTGGIRYLLVFFAWVVLVAWSWWNRSRMASAPGLVVLPLVLAVVTFFVFPPAHTLNRWLFLGLWNTSVESGGELNLSYVAEIGVFHFMVVLLKPGILIGLVLWAGCLRATTQLRSRREFQLPLAMIAFYGAFLLLLPWAQARYMMPLFPHLAILGADWLVDLGRVRRRLATAVAVVMGLSLIWDYRLTYPDLNLNGHQWLGTRYFAGRSTLGYRSIGQVGEDGVQQILNWSLAAVPPGSTVASYISAPHIVAAFFVDPPFRVLNGLANRDALNEADYVLTSLNGDIVVGDGPENPEGNPYKFPLYDRAALERDFERVFTVQRAFELEVATVWQRR